MIRSMIHYIDSHAHLSSSQVYPHIDGVMERAFQAGIKRCVNICTDAETLEKGFELEKHYPQVVNAGATTPHDVGTEGEAMFEVFAKQARAGALVAIGETGLDYHYTHSEPLLQQEFLRRYLRLALECNLPVIIHCREAFADFFRILDEEYTIHGKHAPGVLHCFTGSMAEAEQVILRGWYLSLSGIVTFKKSEALREVAKIAPLEQLLIETDTPYLAPQGRRGLQNEPAYLPETAAAVAMVKGLSLEQVATATAENARTLFKISPD